MYCKSSVHKQIISIFVFLEFSIVFLICPFLFLQLQFHFVLGGFLYDKSFSVSCPLSALLSSGGASLLLRLWYEPMWQEGADVAEQRVCCLRPGPVGDCRKHRLLALPGGGRNPSPQPDYRDTHVPPLWTLEGLLPGW